MKNKTQIIRKKGDFNDLKFEVDLTEYGKTLSDVTDIYFSVKCDESDLDNTLLLKKQSLGEITSSGTTIIAVQVKWPTTDYVNFQVGKEYIAGLFFKFTGNPVADENVDQTFTLKIIQDFLKQN